MDTFAALALATDPPTRNILNRKPEKKSAPLITLNMWKMIIGQAIFQLVVTFVLNFGGQKIFSYDSEHEKKQLRTLVFNTFVWMQIFNQYKYVPPFPFPHPSSPLLTFKHVDMDIGS